MNRCSKYSNVLHIISLGFQFGKQHYAYKYVHMVLHVKLLYSSWYNLLAYFLQEEGGREGSKCWVFLFSDHFSYRYIEYK